MESACMSQRRGQKRKLEDEDQEVEAQGPPVKISRGYWEVILVGEDNNALAKKKVEEKTSALKQKFGFPRSWFYEYEILKFLGEGTYGQVVKCLKKESNDILAMKICKCPEVFYDECTMLHTLKISNAEQFNMVRSEEIFVHENHGFTTFEMLGQSLLGYLKANEFQPLPMQGIRSISEQLLTALAKLREIKIIHGDIKPDNIMLVNHRREPFRIKIIDFGLAIQLPTRSYPLNLATLFYRAPEIMLGLPYTQAVDMWSVGCVVAELLVGAILYSGSSPYDQIRQINETQGPFPEYMILDSSVASEYFIRETENTTDNHTWRLKTPPEYRRQTGMQSHDHRKYHLENLDDLLQVCSRVRRGYNEEHMDRKHCVDMIKKMLEVNHEDRVYPNDALRCNFICQTTKSTDLKWDSFAALYFRPGRFYGRAKRSNPSFIVSSQ